VNKFYLKLPTTDQGLEIPIELNWDFLGKQDSVEKYETTIVDQIIGGATDFEISRFSHNEYSGGLTRINYEFNFYGSGSTSVTATTVADTNLWINSYLAEGFNTNEIYYFTNSFTNSFFKLDFYDTDNSKNKTNYFTVILPVQQGLTQTASTSSYLSNVNIKKPYFVLDFVGDKEGFFFYWLTSTDFLDINTFYMSAKFFDAKLGVFVRMMNRPQAILPNKFVFDNRKYFYNKVILDYQTKTYEIFDGLNPNLRVGTDTDPMRWYEYINPPSQ
jgi:hypothetical protein